VHVLGRGRLQMMRMRLRGQCAGRRLRMVLVVTHGEIRRRRGQRLQQLQRTSENESCCTKARADLGEVKVRHPSLSPPPSASSWLSAAPARPPSSAAIQKSFVALAQG